MFGEKKQGGAFIKAKVGACMSSEIITNQEVFAHLCFWPHDRYPPNFFFLSFFVFEMG